MKILTTLLICILTSYVTIFVGAESFYGSMVKRTALKILNKTVGDSQCGVDLRHFIDGVSDLEPWALEMLDASEKVQSGYLTGNIRQSGNYDECMAIKSYQNDSFIQGKYCLYGISSNMTDRKSIFNVKKQLTLRGIKIDHIEDYLNGIKATSAVCVPLSCSGEDLQLIWNYTEYYFDAKLHFVFDEKYCDYEGRVHFEKMDILAILFFGFVGLIIAFSTMYDLLVFQKQDEEQYNIWMSFSLYSNGKRLFTINRNEQQLGCLHGIRVISMMWIILCHGFMISIFVPNINGVYIFEWKNNVENMIILGGTVSVDTFFVLSGLLVVYVYLQAKENGGKFNLLIFYLHRFLRLTPSLATILLSLTTLFKYLGSGPYWHIIYDLIKKNCDEYWWSTLLYVQNVYNPMNQCLPHGWYLAVDTQLYVLAPIILFPLIKWPKRTIGLVLVLLSLSMVAAFATTWIMKLGAMPFETNKSYYKFIYQATYIRGSAWLLGAILGYAIFKSKSTEIVVEKWTNLSFWMLSIGVMMGIVFGQVSFTRYEYNVIKSSAFNAIGRPLWSLCLCFIIFACSTGHGGFVNKFLSLPVFQILSRLTYSMYLMHLGVLGIIINGRRTVTYFSNMTLFHDFWGDYIFTVFHSISWTLMFESPFLIIEKVLAGNSNMKEKNITSVEVSVMTVSDVYKNKEELKE